MLRSLFAIALLASLPFAAHAKDYDGRPGPVVELETYHSSADTYLAFRGRVFIDNGIVVDEYRMGSTSCGSKTLDAVQVTMLQRAFESSTLVSPVFQYGQNGARCIVGFSLK